MSRPRARSSSPMTYSAGLPTSTNSSKRGQMYLTVRFSNRTYVMQVIARAVVCGIMLLVLPSCGIPPLRKAELGPVLPPSFNGATSSESSSELGIQEFYNDPLLLRLID